MISSLSSWETTSVDFSTAPELPQPKSLVYDQLKAELEVHRALGTPIMGVNLYPLERNFFDGVANNTESKNVISEFYTRREISGEQQAMAWLTNQLSFKRRPNQSIPIPLIDKQQISHLKENNYYHDLVGQYRHLKSKQPDFSQWIFFIQGLHSLTSGNFNDDLSNDELYSSSFIATVRQRIRQLKGQESIDGSNQYWKHTPFAISLASHFHNSFCGHSCSLPDVSKTLFDQRNGRDLGLISSSVNDIIKELLSIDSDFKPTGATRILIDVRHMSPAARKVYYQNFIVRFNEKTDHPELKIPIVATGVGFSGIDSLDEMIRNSQEGKEKDDFRSKGFLAWGYNLSDEDVIAIFQSNGIINLANDRRILGENSNQWLTSLNFRPFSRKRGIQLVKQTIEQLVRIPFDYFLPNPLKIWDIISFFPIVNSTYFHQDLAIDWNTLEEDLLHVLHILKKEEPLWFGSYKPEHVLQKIVAENVGRMLSLQKNEINNN